MKGKGGDTMFFFTVKIYEDNLLIHSFTSNDEKWLEANRIEDLSTGKSYRYQSSKSVSILSFYWFSDEREVFVDSIRSLVNSCPSGEMVDTADSKSAD